MDEVFIATKEAEEALLGAILIESASAGTRDAIKEVSNIIVVSDFEDGQFHDGLRSRIYAAMLSCLEVPHQINVALELERTDKLHKGDCAYLCHLVSVCPCSLDYMDYAQAVISYSDKRKGIESNRGKPIYKDMV